MKYVWNMCEICVKYVIGIQLIKCSVEYYTWSQAWSDCISAYNSVPAWSDYVIIIRHRILNDLNCELSREERRVADIIFHLFPTINKYMIRRFSKPQSVFHTRPREVQENGVLGQLAPRTGTGPWSSSWGPRY